MTLKKKKNTAGNVSTIIRGDTIKEQYWRIGENEFSCFLEQTE